MLVQVPIFLLVTEFLAQVARHTDDLLVVGLAWRLGQPRDRAHDIEPRRRPVVAGQIDLVGFRFATSFHDGPHIQYAHSTSSANVMPATLAQTKIPSGSLILRMVGVPKFPPLDGLASRL